MRSLRILSLAILFFAQAPFVNADEDCNLDDLIKHLRRNLTDQFKDVTENTRATEHARLMKRKGLDKIGYMNKWELKRANQAGPWAMKGNTYVHGVLKSDGQKWMDEVGMKSFGLGYFEHPDSVYDTPSAVLRWKNVYLSFGEVRGGPVSVFDRGSNATSAFTETTFMATEEELAAIRKFIVSRVNREITALKSVSGSGQRLEPGDVIHPEFDFNGSNLFEESCAYACTSMFNPRWLEHYDAPEALKLALVAKDRGIRPDTNAKALIFYNYRNTQADAITVVGLPDNTTNASFLSENHWSQAGGMMWGFIPDRQPAKPSPNYTSKRFTLNEWLGQ